MPLTPAQEATLAFIRQYHAEHHIAPSTRVIAQWHGICQTGAAMRVNALVRKGQLTRCPSSGRIIFNASASRITELEAQVAALQAENTALRNGQPSSNP